MKQPFERGSLDEMVCRECGSFDHAHAFHAKPSGSVSMRCPLNDVNVEHGPVSVELRAIAYSKARKHKGM